ncbi:hypothetical protein IMG5_159620 [Ichthyophthirius multifiliis]|uniref:Uncharacterized protein n=1 Tax=Ichthyophthirius multifiliis TaxID=5932 RepID=G0QZT0_ICHMU|nr:hypothetical protein IMG5_159620 [Ichthyophthirius multifiliis]EGR29268.1 hypothetical protein IMG5_159620 [Ichthyophthirius multifiliis]|eukprot:XP_004030504.1 hypothetical protein IMG5_159620 [Ichthyophthirius multifiliis]
MKNFQDAYFKFFRNYKIGQKKKYYKIQKKQEKIISFKVKIINQLIKFQRIVKKKFPNKNNNKKSKFKNTRINSSTNLKEIMKHSQNIKIIESHIIKLFNYCI